VPDHSSYYREFPETAVPSLLAEFEARMSQRMPHYRAFDAAYESKFWRHRRGEKTDARFEDSSEDGMTVVEVNRAYGYIEGYAGSLFNDRVRITAKDDVDGRGDAFKFQTLCNQWLRAKRTSRRVLQAIRLALMHDGSGLKLGTFDDPRRKGMSRIALRVVPYWELVTDYNVVDYGDQRFVGHLYWMPLGAARKKFNRPDLQGSTRPDPLSSNKNLSASKGLRARTKGTGVGSETIDDKFVRVFEMYNFVDDYQWGESNLVTGKPNANWEPECEPDGAPKPPISGRYEVYLPDAADCGSKPVKVLPLPHADADGVPLAPIMPLVLTGSPKQPLHGISALERVYDQIRELNVSRTFKSNAVKRNARQLLAMKGTFGKEAKEAYRRGLDGAILELEKASDGSVTPNTATAPLNLGTIPADNYRYDQEIENDLAQGSTQAPFTRGEATGTSATEVKVLNAYSQTEVGHMGLCRDLVLEEVVVLLGRMFISQIRADGKPITLLHRRKTITITEADLDANFDITVVPGATTPMAEDRERQTFLAILPTITALIDKVVKGDPISAMLLDDMVEKYGLDEKYLSDNIMRLMEASKTKAQELPKIKAQPGAGSALPGAGSSPTAEIPDNAMAIPEDVRGTPQPQPGPPGTSMGGGLPNEGGAEVVVA
jgi:hypothetical protein